MSIANMNRTKLSEGAIDLIAARFRVLGEPMRLKLLIALEERERNVSDLVAATGATQANVSRHLQTLTEAGILDRRKEGLNVYYFIADPGIFNLCEQVCGSLQKAIGSSGAGPGVLGMNRDRRQDSASTVAHPETAPGWRRKAS
jgi:DNA-binding transcriptional ArsR family regulator